MSESITDIVLIESWRQERAALQHKLGHLQTGGGGRSLKLSKRISSVRQLRHKIAEYDVLIDEYRRGSGAPIRLGPALPNTEEGHCPESLGAL